MHTLDYYTSFFYFLFMLLYTSESTIQLQLLKNWSHFYRIRSFDHKLLHLISIYNDFHVMHEVSQWE